MHYKSSSICQKCVRRRRSSGSKRVLHSLYYHDKSVSSYKLSIYRLIAESFPIVSPSFLQVVLRLRKRILNAAFNEETEDAEVYPTIISCVDILFVHFSDMVVAIACNQCETKNVPDTLRKRLMTEALQLTSQLPCMYHSH